MRNIGKHRLFLLGLVILVALYSTKPISADARTIQGVTGSGEAAVSAITAEQGQLLALQRARLNAVEKAVGVSIVGSTLVRDATFVADFLASFSRGFITKETVRWLALEEFRSSPKGAPIPLYRVEITATVEIPERTIDPEFNVESSLDRTTYVAGDSAEIRILATRRAHLAVFNITADDRVVMLYPRSHNENEGIIEAGETHLFPSVEMGMLLELFPVEGHKQDSEAFMVTAVPVTVEKTFRYSDHFIPGHFYSVPEFFSRYSRCAPRAVEKILPYDVREK